jgi:hypothetical protein
MPKLNVKHINKILAYIREDLDRFYMPTWGVKGGSRAAAVISDIERATRKEKLHFPACGTVACFAGWSKLLSVPEANWDGMFDRYGELEINWREEVERLGLTEDESTLFGSVRGTREQQLRVVEKRLCAIAKARVALGEEEAKGIDI